MKSKNQNISSNCKIKVLKNISKARSEYKNILIWNGAALLIDLSELFPKANILDIELEENDYKIALYLANNNEEDQINNYHNISIEYAPIEQGISGDYVLKDYLLAPAKSPYEFDLIIINNIFEPESFRYAKNYINDNSLILIISEDYKPKEKDEFTIKTFTINNISKENTIKYSLISKSNTLIAELIDKFKINYLHQEKNKNDNLIELFDRPKLSILFIQKYDDNFLKDLYKDTSLGTQKYSEQMLHLLSKQHLYSDYFSAQFQKQGCEVNNIIANCEELHIAWKKEHNTSIEYGQIIEQQIIDLSPDAIFLIEAKNFSVEEVNTISKHTNLISAYINNISRNPLQDDILSKIDIIFTSDESEASKLINHNNIIHLPNLFDVLCDYSRSDYNNREYDIQVLCQENEEELINYIKDNLPSSTINISDFKQIGNDNLPNEINANIYSDNLFSVLSNSKIIITSSIEKLNEINPEITAENILGCGALLITNKPDSCDTPLNNSKLEVGKDFLTYRSPEEAILLAKFLLENPEDAEKMSNNAKKKILNNNLYGNYSGSMMKELEKIFIKKLNS